LYYVLAIVVDELVCCSTSKRIDIIGQSIQSITFFEACVGNSHVAIGCTLLARDHGLKTSLSSTTIVIVITIIGGEVQQACCRCEHHRRCRRIGATKRFSLDRRAKVGAINGIDEIVHVQVVKGFEHDLRS